MTNTTAAPVNEQTLKNLPANVQGPGYDRNALKEGILHIGVGGFHRSHQALYLDDLIGGGESGADQWAICGVGIMQRQGHARCSHKAGLSLYARRANR